MNIFGVGITELIFVLLIIPRLLEVEKAEQESTDTQGPGGIARRSKSEDKDETIT